MEPSDKIDAAAKLIKVFVDAGDSFSLARRKALKHVDLSQIEVRHLMDSCDYIMTRAAFLRQNARDRQWVKN